MLTSVRVLPVLMRHVAAYRDLVVSAGSEMKADLSRRLIAILVAAIVALGALVLACGWLLMSVWEADNRNLVIASVILLLVIGAVLAVRWALQSRSSGPQHARLREEMRKDFALLDQLERMRDERDNRYERDGRYG